MQVQTMQYRQHVIKAMMKKTTAEAVVFRGTQLVLRVIEPALESAIVSAKLELDRRLQDRFAARRRYETSEGEGHVGTTEEYIEVLEDLRISKPERAMLIAHAKAPERILTAGELAEAGWGPGTSYSNANAHYGALGGRVAGQLDLQLGVYNGGKPLKTCATAESLPGTGEVGAAEWRWRMHDEVAAALKAMGWV